MCITGYTKWQLQFSISEKACFYLSEECYGVNAPLKAMLKFKSCYTLFIMCVHTRMPLCACMPQLTGGDQKTTRGSWFSPPLVWALRIELRSSGLGVSALYPWNHLTWPRVEI